MMRVLIVTNGIPSEQSPLLGIFEWDQAKALVKAGIKVDFFAVDLRSFRRIRPWGIRHGEKAGIIWHSISIPIGAVPLPFMCKIGTIALRKLYQNVFGTSSKAPDIMHAHFTDMGYIASEVAVEEKIPLIITEHSSLMVKPVISESLNQIAAKGYQRAIRVLAVSNSLKENIYRHTGVIAEVVPNIVPAEFHYEQNEHIGYKFIAVANLIHGKRINVLLRAFSQLFDSCDGVALEIVGDGEQRDNLKRLASELHISERVTFHGLLSRNDIEKLYKTCDCFVLPSAFETFGVVYIEAMAAGLPVIATRCGGPEDFVTEENGILVNVDDVEGLKGAMMKMYTEHGKYDCRKISDKIKARFSAETIGKQLVNVYKYVLRDCNQGKLMV